MPIYEYQCPSCGHRFDLIQKMSDDPVSVCPKCAGTEVKKLISATSFVLKGSGWYKDHYGLKSGGDDKPASGATPAAAAPAEAKSETKTTTPTSGSGSSTPPATTP